MHPIVDGLQRKVCAVCCTAKPLAAYRQRRDGVFGYGSYCIACAATRRSELESGRDGTAYHRERRFGVDANTFDAMLAAQDGRCAVCQTAEPRGIHPWAVDHDHATGRVRGVLCGPCNGGMGLLGDDADRVEAAAGYLRADGHPAASALGVAAQGDPARYRGYRR